MSNRATHICSESEYSTMPLIGKRSPEVNSISNPFRNVTCASLRDCMEPTVSRAKDWEGAHCYHLVEITGSAAALRSAEN